MSVACERALTQFGLARKFHIAVEMSVARERALTRHHWCRDRSERQAVEMSVARERALTQACLITFLKGLSNGRNECCP